jgi:hypothetical protein
LEILTDEETRRKIEAMIHEFENEDIDTRILAQNRVAEYGHLAVPELQRGLDRGDSEVRLRCAGILESLWDADPTVKKLCRERAQPQGAPDVELTGLVLLCFLSAGYTHLSQDGVGEPSLGAASCSTFGMVVKRGLRWLLDRQDAKGAFDSKNPAANAIAAMALSEAYGMTASSFLRDPAQKALDWVVKERSVDDRFLAWKALLLRSAELNELRFGVAELRRLQEQLAEKTGLLASSSAFILNRRDMKVMDGVLLEKLIPSSMELPSEELLIASLGIYHWGGPTSAAWKSWSEPLKNLLLSGQKGGAAGCCKGSWVGRNLSARLRSTALNSLTLMLYYRYSNHFGVAGCPDRPEGLRAQPIAFVVPRGSPTAITGAH